ncbi:(2Fe-2S)-binding protein [Spirochaeta cellobiosiphila]|uniref:(2Fe-2S)-binding protein n=1 Tax=Spirochaeta cellobiosiphila TaxID=504483 RepID=UPI0004093EA6|nr:(2Fe-2S)-binding protein [Spirochaeta cellobiosiphila]
MKDYNDRLLEPEPFLPEEDDQTIICRCEEITKGEIRQAVHEGMYTLTEVKRFLRTGMGLCQGSRCGNLVRRIVAKELGVDPLSLAPPTNRAPMRPTAMHILAKEVETKGEDK